MDEVGASKLDGNNDKIFIDKEKIDSKIVYHFVKRALDIVGSLLGLLILSPLFLIVGFMIKKEDSGGPVFFSQDRVGKDGELFKMYKFRSMCVDAEEKLEYLLELNEVEGAMFKIRLDPRITKVGGFLRKTSIDELPQFFNVLKGDMSLIGPRPPLIREVKEYSEYDLQRLIIKPGCTGLWQVNGRNNVSFSQMVDLDIEYISNLSLLNDFKILIKTIFVMIKPNNAY